MGLFKQTKYKIYILKQHHNVLYIQKIMRLNELPDLVKYKDKQFNLDWNQPTFISKTINFFIQDNGTQLTFLKIKSKANPKDLDLIVGQNIIRELTRGVMDNKKEKIGMVLMGMILGGLIVGLFLVVYYNNQIQSMLREQRFPTDTTPITPIIPSSITLKTIWRLLKYVVIGNI